MCRTVLKLYSIDGRVLDSMNDESHERPSELNLAFSCLRVAVRGTSTENSAQLIHPGIQAKV